MKWLARISCMVCILSGNMLAQYDEEFLIVVKEIIKKIKD